MLVTHDEVNSTTRRTTYETTVTILSAMESQRWVTIVVKWAECPMMRDVESQRPSDLLYRQVLKLLNIEFAEHTTLAFDTRSYVT